MSLPHFFIFTYFCCFLCCVSLFMSLSFTAFLTASRTSLNRHKLLFFLLTLCRVVFLFFPLHVCVCVCFSESEMWQWRTNLPQMSPAAYFLSPTPLLIVQSPKPRCLSASLAARSRPAPWPLQHHSFVCVACNCTNLCITNHTFVLDGYCVTPYLCSCIITFCCELALASYMYFPTNAKYVLKFILTHKTWHACCFFFLY